MNKGKQSVQNEAGKKNHVLQTQREPKTKTKKLLLEDFLVLSISSYVHSIHSDATS